MDNLSNVYSMLLSILCSSERTFLVKVVCAHILNALRNYPGKEQQLFWALERRRTFHSSYSRSRDEQNLYLLAFLKESRPESNPCLSICEGWRLVLRFPSAASGGKRRIGHCDGTDAEPHTRLQWARERCWCRGSQETTVAEAGQVLVLTRGLQRTPSPTAGPFYTHAAAHTLCQGLLNKIKYTPLAARARHNI